MITVKLENPPGVELNTRQFTPGQALRIGAVVKTMLGGPAWGAEISFELYGDGFSSYYQNANSDLSGNAWVDWLLPNVVTKATIRVVDDILLGGSVIEIPIGIGVEPDPIIIEPDWFKDLRTVLIVGIVLIGASYAYSAAKR